MRLLLSGTVALSLALSGCDFKGTPLAIEPEFDETFSFEEGLDDWYPEAHGVTDPPLAWEVTRSDDRASAGDWSVRLRLANDQAGKIWLERVYEVEPHQRYDVRIELQLATADFAGVSGWNVVAGAAPEPPAASGGLALAGDTGNAETLDQGHVWVERSLTMQALSDEDGELFVYVGVWGTSAVERSYYVDDVRVTMTRVGPPVR